MIARDWAKFKDAPHCGISASIARGKFIGWDSESAGAHGCDADKDGVGGIHGWFWGVDLGMSDINSLFLPKCLVFSSMFRRKNRGMCFEERKQRRIGDVPSL